MPDTTTKIRTQEKLFFGSINRLDQIPAYFTLAQQSYGNFLGFGLCLSARTKSASPLINPRKIVLLLDRDASVPQYSLSYAFWPDSFAQTLSQEEKTEGFGSVYEEIKKVFEAESVDIEGFPNPVLGRYNRPVRGNVASFLMELSRKYDEAKKQVLAQEVRQPEQKKTDRRFTGRLESLEQLGGYFELVKLAYQRYDSFGLIFSSARKHPLYVLLENSDKDNRNGPYVASCAWFDERVKLSESDMTLGPENYIIKRVKARLAESDGKIEGYSNPPVGSIPITFPAPVNIDRFLWGLLNQLGSEDKIEDTQKVDVADEDKEVKLVETKKPDVPLGDDFEKEGEQKLDDFFGEK